MGWRVREAKPRGLGLLTEKVNFGLSAVSETPAPRIDNMRGVNVQHMHKTQFP